MPNRPKLFAGIELDAGTRAQCAAVAARLQAQGVPARFEAPEKLHFTLAFLGWVQPERVEPIRNALRSLAARTPVFGLVLNTLGAFPNERNPRVVWIGAREQGAAFTALAANVRSEYGALGFRFDKHAVAHVTIARIKEPRVHLPMLDVCPIPLAVRELTLFESVPDSRTTRYEIRDRTACRLPD